MRTRTTLVPRALLAARRPARLADSFGKLTYGLRPGKIERGAPAGPAPKARPGVQGQGRRNAQGFDTELPVAAQERRKSPQRCSSSCSTTWASDTRALFGGPSRPPTLATGWPRTG